jgi:hypothetical protein
MTTNTWTASTSGDWTTAGDWSSGVPTSTQDVLIGSNAANTIVTSASIETVDSIGINSGDQLAITGGTFGALDATGPNGIFGEISAQDADFSVGGGTTNHTINNSGLIFLQSLTTTQTHFYFDNNVTLDGAGIVVMDISGQGSITSNQITSPSGLTATLTNQDNTIAGTGLITDIFFINHGTVDTNINQNNLSEHGTLTIAGNASGGAFDNENLVKADDNGTLILGSTGQGNQSVITNNGTIAINNDQNTTHTNVEIAGQVTIKSGGDGKIQFEGSNGDGNNLVSNGQAATLILEDSTLSGAGNLGDSNLTLSIVGTVIEETTGALVINAANTTIESSSRMEAAESGMIFANGQITDNGIVHSISGGEFFLNGRLDNLTGHGLVEIGPNSQFFIQTGGSVTGNVQFTGAGSTLKLSNRTLQIGGEIVGAVAGDNLDLAFQAFAAGDKAVWTQRGSAGTLNVETSTGAILKPLELEGHYTSSDFSVVADGANDVLVKVTNTPAIKSDYNHDGTSDALLVNSAGTAIDWILQFGNYQSFNFIGNTSGFNVAGSGDFNGDGTADVLLQNSSGSVIDWIMNNGQFASFNPIGSAAGFNILGTGDFNADGTSDVLLQSSSGNMIDWIMNNGVYSSSGGIGNANAAGFGVVGTGDFNGDGTSDILLENGAGNLIDWIMQNGTYQSFNNIGNTQGYGVVGTGDFNNDGVTDLLLENGSGNLIDWTMKNGTFAGWNEIGNTSGFSVVGTGDYNHDGSTDILLENSSQSVIDWTMQNGVYSGFQGVGNASGFAVTKT